MTRSNSQSLLGLLLLALLLARPTHARAEETARLSDRGRTLLAGSVGGYWSNNERSPGVVVYRSFEVLLSPSLLYFVRDRLGVGGWLHYGYRRLPNQLYTLVDRDLGAGVQAAYEVELAPRLGLLLLPQAGYLLRRREIDEPTGSWFSPGGAGRTQQQRSPLANQGLTDSAHVLQLAVSTPLIVHLTDSIAVGLGPYVQGDFYLNLRNQAANGERYRHLRVGVSTWIGGSF